MNFVLKETMEKWVKALRSEGVNMDVATFFSRVKDEKIRWTAWGLKQYFIPASITGDQMIGSYTAADGGKSTVILNCQKGFQSVHNSHHWELVPEPLTGHFRIEGGVQTMPKENNKCQCDFREVIMIKGCQCGGA